MQSAASAEEVDAPPNETTNRARFRYTHFDELPVVGVPNTVLKARSFRIFRMNSTEVLAVDSANSSPTRFERTQNGNAWGYYIANNGNIDLSTVATFLLTLTSRSAERNFAFRVQHWGRTRPWRRLTSLRPVRNLKWSIAKRVSGINGHNHVANFIKSEPCCNKEVPYWH
eukprot:6205039-Pleurochrysis_carterae.AAC.1